MTVLAIVAHPDDESLFAGGTLAGHAKRGDSVQVAALSDGVGSRPPRGVTAYARLEQFYAACRLLGALPFRDTVFPDQQSDTVPQLQINQWVADFMLANPSDVIYTHHVGDLNLDHRRVAEAVLVATRTSAARVLCMAPEFPSRCVGPLWIPNMGVGIRDTMDQKVHACLCYTDELREWPHPRSERAIRERPTEWFMEIR